MKLIKSFLTKNPCYTSKKQITVKGLMLHSVGCSQPSASVFVKNWNKASHVIAVHAFIDANTGYCYQTLPWNYRASHCGGAGNNTHIAVEMCESSYIKYTNGDKFTCSNTAKAKLAAEKTYNSAVELFAMLCKEYKLNPLADGVILSHKEGYNKKIASNHGDPEHLWKGLGLSYTMDGFRKDVYKAMNADVTTPEDNTSTSKSFKVKVTIDNLRIRKGPGTNYATTGKYTGIGVFTITETKAGSGSNAGWGKLASEAGWISLDYVTKL